MCIIPSEIYEQIMYYLPIKDILSYGQVNSDMFTICNNELLWYKLFRREYPEVDISFNQRPKSTWKESVLKFPKAGQKFYNIIYWNISQSPAHLKYREHEYRGMTIFLPFWPRKQSETKYESVKLNGPIVTVKDILEAIYDYYQQQLTIDQVKNYKVCAIDHWTVRGTINAVKKGHYRKRVDIMGRWVDFEGLFNVRGGYQVRLGYH